MKERGVVMRGVASHAGEMPRSAEYRWQMSPAVYPSVLVVSMVLGRWLQYVTGGDAWVRGQPAAVVVQALAFVLAVGAWILAGSKLRSNRSSTLLVTLFGLAWVIHIVLAVLRGDAYMHLVWLMIPILAMLWWKPLTALQWQTVVWVAGVALAAALAITIGLELVGVLERPYLAPGLIDFEVRNYWLPLSEPLGIEGRWQGPFGHSGDTGAVAALVLVMGVAVWRKTSPVVVVVAVTVLLMTSVRSAYIAAAAGLAVLFVFGKSRWVAKFAMSTRLVVSGAVVALVTLVLVSQSINLTGRSSTIWPGFWELWLTSPVLGVGPGGIAENGGVTALSVHAHNLLLDELTRNGLLGFVLQVTAVGFAVVLAFRAMLLRAPGPLAILVAYGAIGVTQVMNDWIHPSLPVMLVIASGLWADSILAQRRLDRETAASLR